MIVIKIVGKTYKKDELQRNSVIIRKWFATQCINKKELNQKYHTISDNDAIEEE